MRQQLVGWRWVSGALCGLAAIWAALLDPAAARAQYLPTQPPPVQRVDQNNISFNGSIFYTLPLLSIGPSGPGGLSLEVTSTGDGLYGWSTNLTGQVSLSPSGSPPVGATVSVGNHSDNFGLQNGVYVSLFGTGAKLTVVSNGTGGGYTVTYAPSDGTTYVFNTGLVTPNNQLISITYPTGETVAYNYSSVGGPVNAFGYPASRLISVTTNTGYGIHFDYDPNSFMSMTKATAWNMAVDSCNPTAVTCTFNAAYNWPTATFSPGFGANVLPPVASITDSAGVTTSFTYFAQPNTANYYLTTIKKPSGWTETFGYTPVAAGQSPQGAYELVSATFGSGTWTYGQANGASTGYLTVVDPYADLSYYSYSGSNNCRFPNVHQDALGRATSYQCDPNYQLRVTQITQPEGGYKTYAYDANGNLTTVTAYPKPSVGGSSIVTFQANYPCTSAATCDKPNWVKDARGNETDYTFDPGTGLLMESQSPAVNGMRPTVANSYTAISLPGGGSVYRLTSSATCATSAATVSISGLTASLTCAGGSSDAIVTTTSYAGSYNALPTSVTADAGSGHLNATTTTAYDNYGDVISVTDPLSNTTQTWYDAGRRKLGVVGPDPDGSGPLLNRAQVIKYNADGLVSEVDQGTMSGYANPAASGSGFTPLIQTVTAYDSIDRKIQNYVSAGGTTYALTEYGYDLASRLQCTAVRMNSSQFNSLIQTPSSACALDTTGSYGPDRITYDNYDAANELVQTITGYATGAQRNEKTIVASAVVATPYSGDGLPSAVMDGDGNVSTYIYDGFDRLSQLEYPSPTSQGSSSTSDYEGFGYDAASNLTSHRLRDGNTISFTYDALNRRATKTPPESANAVAYGYDNLGRLTSENFTNNAALNLSFGYDALGRRTSQTGPLGKVSSLWDLGGRRQRLSWPDGMYIAYTWDNVGEMTNAEENGATSGVGLLASFGYDNLGHRKTLARGDGVATTYGYDPAGRLTSLVHAGGSSNQGFNPIAYDPANDMVSFTTTNAAYAWAGPAASTIAYQPNGQNQYTSVGSAPFSYDAKGNLTTTSSGGPVFGYDSENRLTSMSGSPGASLAYYPDGSLYQTVGSSTTRFLYDGDQIIGEYDGSGNLLRRYVPGPAIDEPLVWYEGSGTASRRWLLGDHQGSIIAWADSSGNIPAANIDSYDEYGQPGASNSGRFQYTGQPWIPEVAAYDYRARDYMPGIGRFLQTDPKGYEAGLNLYAYATDDPVDHVDPTGEDWRDWVVCALVFCNFTQEPRDPPSPRGQASRQEIVTRSTPQAPEAPKTKWEPFKDGPDGSDEPNPEPNPQGRPAAGDPKDPEADPEKKGTKSDLLGVSIAVGKVMIHSLVDTDRDLVKGIIDLGNTPVPGAQPPGSQCNGQAQGQGQCPSAASGIAPPEPPPASVPLP